MDNAVNIKIKDEHIYLHLFILYIVRVNIPYRLARWSRQNKI